MWIQVGLEAAAPPISQSWEQREHAQLCAIRTIRTIHDAHPSLAKSSEAKLVRDSLHALQGLPAAITGLEALAATFSLQAADKTAHGISTLWQLSSSTSALAKLLLRFCQAGWHRCQLDRFVDFFLGFHTRKAGASPGLLNQAFAVAVRTVLQGQSASLKFYFDHGSLSLLELFLHTEDLRVQVQALTKICSIGSNDENNVASFTTGNAILENFKAFPKGADLLTRLYNLLLEPDPVHLELLRFLFARTYEPYALFVRSCIFCAELKDPHGEFILEQTRPRRAESVEKSSKIFNESSLKVRSGGSIPVFLVDVCSKILRTGQQLEVLLKLPETRDFAHALSSSSAGLLSKDLDNVVFQAHRMTVAFDKNGLKYIAKQRQLRMTEIFAHYRKFFGSDMVVESNFCDLESEPKFESETVDIEKSIFTAQADFPIIIEGSDCTQDSTSDGHSDQEIACYDDSSSQPFLLQSRFAEEVFEEAFAGNAFLSAYNRGTSWLEVGLPRNPFVSHSQGNIYGYISTLFTDTADAWDIRSKLVNEDTLAKHLVPEITQVGILSLTKPTKTDIDAVSVLLKDDNLPAIAKRTESVQDSIKPQHSVDTCSGNGERTEISLPPQGGGSWVSSLKMTRQHTIQFEDPQRKSCCDIPFSVAVDKSIIEEILVQYRIVSTFTVRLLQDHLHLHEHYLALRRYYFMEVGDWADNFITALSSHKWGHSRGHHIVDVQGILETALQKSSCCGDCLAERLHICRSSESDAFINLNGLDAYDFIELGYQVDWPLNLILTSDAFCLYKSIFRLLLRVKRAVSALGEISSSLQIMERSMRRISFSDQQRDRFRAVQLFRHQIGHFVTAFQRHIHSQLLHVVWSDFIEATKHEIQDMQDLGLLHYKYLTNAAYRCFLSPEHTGVKARMDDIMQCLLDFRSSLKNTRSCDNENACSDKLYTKVLELRSLFHENVCYLHKNYSNSEAHQLSDFWTALDYNGYFASTC